MTVSTMPRKLRNPSRAFLSLEARVAIEAFSDNHVQPRRAGRREMHDKARVLGRPLLRIGVAMRGVVVHDQMQAQVLGRAVVD
jgi:hypothetical protein